MNTRVIVDVREPFEFESGHVKGALNIPPTSLMAGAPELADVAKDAEIVLYCRTGSRSNVAMQILKQQGFTNLVNGVSAGRVEKTYGL